MKRLQGCVVGAIRRIGSSTAAAILSELRRHDALITPEAMYEALVALEGRGVLVVAPVCGEFGRSPSLWAVRAPRHAIADMAWERVARACLPAAPRKGAVATGNRLTVHLCR